MSGRMTEANLEQYKPTVFEQIITLREGDDEIGIEATLAFILIDLEGLSKHRFTLEQEDQLMAIEMKARELRSKLT